MDPEDIPEPDRLEGVPHPRMAAEVFGHGAAERAVLDALDAGRMHHAWLISGPRGIGKASFAWRLAAHLIAAPPAEAGLFGAAPPAESLAIDPQHPVARRLRALSEPRLYLLRRPWDAQKKRLATQITAESTRGLRSFFALSAADGGRRVVIVDAADEMNATAANAVLKVLEEPPAEAVLLLVCHRPSALLPTIRSRCRSLKLAPLGAEDMAAALAQVGVTPEPDQAQALRVLAAGSVGAAVQLLEGDGVVIYTDLVALFGRGTPVDRPAALAFAAKAGSRDADALAQSLTLIDLFLARLARTGVTGTPGEEAVPGEADLARKLAPDAHAARHWATLQAQIVDRARRGAAANLDPAALILDTVLKIDAGAQHLLPTR